MEEISDFMAIKIDEIAFIHEDSTNPNEGVDEVAELAKLEKAAEAIPILHQNEEIMNGIEQRLAILEESQRSIENEIFHVPQFLYPESKLHLSTHPNLWTVRIIYFLLFVASLFLVCFELNTLPSYLDAMGIAEPGSLALYLPGLATSIYGIGKNCNMYLNNNSSFLNTKKEAVSFITAFFIYIVCTVCTPTIATDIWSDADLATFVALSINLVAILSATVWILNLASIITHAAIKLREVRRQGQIVSNPAFRTLKEELFAIDEEVKSLRQTFANHEAINENLYASVKLYIHHCVLFYQYHLRRKQQATLERERLLQSKKEYDQKVMGWLEHQSKSLQQQIDSLKSF